MKTFKYKYLLLFSLFASISIGFTACSDDDDDNDEIVVNQTNNNTSCTSLTATDTNGVKLTVNMVQRANNMNLVMNTNNKPYTNAMGHSFNVSKLKYLISDLTFHKVDGNCFTLEGYHFVDASDSTTITYIPQARLPLGDYTKISFTFGFDEEDNVKGPNYTDLNLVPWGWPDPLGGGYHFMQLEGDYDSSGTSKFFATHMGTAADRSVNPPLFTVNHFNSEVDTNFTVNSDFELKLVMNIEQWYEDPYTWDFNVYNAPIMPVYDAQIRLNENGPSVFSIE
ncbi:MAG: hypothetical protein RIC95_11335 [Vicingaceae bacterium]